MLPRVALTGVTTFAFGGGGSSTCQTVIVVDLPDGTMSGSRIGSIVSITFSGCSGVIPFTVEASGLPYALNADSQSGTIAGPVTFLLNSSIGCSATESGTIVPVSYDNNVSQLTVPGTGQNLALSNVNVGGCQNLLHDGDFGSISGQYNADAAVAINES